jgi:hypothetical protein
LFSLRRFRRLIAVGRDTFNQTRSPGYTAWFLFRYVLAKLPILLQQAAAARESRLVAATVQKCRVAAEPCYPQIAVKITGGLGDGLVIARFLRDLAEQTGPLCIDIFSLHPQQSRWIFSGVKGIRFCHNEIVFDHVLANYDAALCVNQFVVVHDDLIDWRKLAAHRRLVAALRAIVQYRPKIDIFVENYPYMDNFLAQKAVFSNHGRADFLHGIAALAYGGDDLPVASDSQAPERHGLLAGHYITVNNGFDTDFFVGGKRATKCYPHFDAVIRQLRERLPGIQFVQIGARTSEALPAADVSLIGQTSLPEAAGLLAGARLHLDIEGGLVHLARCVGTVSAVVFGPTPSSYFGYAANINIDPTFCGGCWWITQTWMALCPRGLAEPRCMAEQPASAVVAKVVAYLQARDAMLTVAALGMAKPKSLTGAGHLAVT